MPRPQAPPRPRVEGRCCGEGPGQRHRPCAWQEAGRAECRLLSPQAQHHSAPGHGAGEEPSAPRENKTQAAVPFHPEADRGNRGPAGHSCWDNLRPRRGPVQDSALLGSVSAASFLRPRLTDVTPDSQPNFVR